MRLFEVCEFDDLIQDKLWIVITGLENRYAYKERSVHSWVHADYANMTMFTDCLMYHVFHGAPDVVEHMLEVVLHKKFHEIKLKVEHLLKFSTGTGVRMDVFAVDENQNYYNIEIQNNDEGATIERCDYNGAAMKVHYSYYRNKKRVIPKTMVMMITSTGINCHDHPYYRYSLKGEHGEETGVGTEIIYVNGTWKDDSDFGKMMHDFGCPDPSQMKDPVFAKRVAYVKSNKTMRRLMDDYEYQHFYLNGVKHTVNQTAIRMLRAGCFTREQILIATELSPDKLDEVIREEEAHKTKRHPTTPRLAP